MSKFFLDYDVAHAHAQAAANRSGRDYGIERTREYGKAGMTVRALPREDKRQGWETRCEVVRPELGARQGDEDEDEAD